VAIRSAFAGALVASLLASSVFAPGAGAAAPVGADGIIHACYKAKGKHKGAVRIVPAGKKCKRKKREKPIQWNVAGQIGTPGASGQSGSSLEVTTPLTKIESLESTVQSLTSALNTACGQVQTLTTQSNGIGTAVSSILGAGLPAPLSVTIGSLIPGTTVPAALPAFSCPAI
jgi:hypothetical protein